MFAFELFAQLVEITVVATIVSAFLMKLRQPNLFAYIVAGVILGPLVLGGIDFASLGLPFPIGIKEITPEIRLLSDLGAAFLLFSIGIETSVKRLLQIGKPMLIGTVLQVIGVIGLTVALTNLTGLLSLEAALFVGTIISFSSTMIVIKLLADKKETNTLNGRIMIAILLIQDLLVILFVPLLQNISQISDPYFFAPIIGKSLLLVIIALLANRLIFPRLFTVAAREQELFFLASISTAFLFIGVSSLLGIPISIGAFIGGLSLSSLPYNTAIFSKIRALRDFFLTIFFVSLGAGLSFSFGALPLALMAMILLIIFVAKPLVFTAVGMISGYGAKISAEIGISLAQVSEFGFVIAALGATAVTAAETPALSEELLSFIITAIAFSMIMTPHLMNHSARIANALNGRMERGFRVSSFKFVNRKIDELMRIPGKEKLKGHVIIIGGGLMGRTLARKLKAQGRVIIVDSDPEIVLQGQKDGLPFVYGTNDDPELIEKTDLEDARAMVIALPKHKESLEFVKAAKRLCPELSIFATANHFYDAIDFYANGVDFVSIPTIMGPEAIYNRLVRHTRMRRAFRSPEEKRAHIKYLKEQAKEELKYKKQVIF